MSAPTLASFVALFFARPLLGCAVCFGGGETTSAALWASTAVLLALIVVIELWLWRLFRGILAHGQTTAGVPAPTALEPAVAPAGRSTTGAQE